MSIVLCAIAEGAHPDPAPARGPGGEPLEAVRAQGLSAIVAPAPAPAARPTVDQLWEFTEVLQRLGTAGPILPVRYGTVLPDLAAVRTVLVDNHARFTERLAEVRGAVEFALRARPRRDDGDLTPDPAATGTATRPSGTAYLMGRLAVSRRQDDLARTILAAVGPLTRDLVERRDRPPGVAVACLVDSAEGETFLARVDELAERLDPAVELTCTGPWPPFSFSGDRR